MRKSNARRPDGRLKSSVYIGDGKYKYIYAKTQKELDKKILEVKNALGKGIDVTAESDTFGEWAFKWLGIKETEVSWKRYTAYKGNIDKFEPLFGRSLSRLRPVDFQMILNDLHKKEGLSVATLSNCRCAARQVYALAIANRVTDFDPLSAVHLPKEPAAPKRRALTAEERQWIIDTPHRAQTAAMLMMFAGLRRGEMIALTWNDVDLSAKTISIRRTAEQTAGGMIVKEGAKSESGVRVIDIPDILVDHLKKEERTCSFVVHTVKNKMLTETGWKRLWNSYLAELNFKYGDFPENYKKPNSRFAPEKIPFVIPRFTAHWLRHTYITLLYLSGVDVMTAKELAGHSEISTTLEIYTHLDREYKRNQLNKLNEYIRQDRSSDLECS
jgi:integrase